MIYKIKRGKNKYVIRNIFDRIFKFLEEDMITQYMCDFCIDREAWYAPELSSGINRITGIEFDENNRVEMGWKPDVFNGYNTFKIVCVSTVNGVSKEFSITHIFFGEEVGLEMKIEDKSRYDGHDKMKYDWCVNIFLDIVSVNNEVRHTTHRAVLFSGEKPDFGLELQPTIVRNAYTTHNIEINRWS